VIQRNIQNSIRRALSDTPVVLLNGARQTGKTTLVQELAATSGSQYFTLDDVATLGLAVGDPSGFIRNLTGPVVMDEIQKAPDWKRYSSCIACRPGRRIWANGW